MEGRRVEKQKQQVRRGWGETQAAVRNMQVRGSNPGFGKPRCCFTSTTCQCLLQLHSSSAMLLLLMQQSALNVSLLGMCDSPHLSVVLLLLLLLLLLSMSAAVDDTGEPPEEA